MCLGDSNYSLGNSIMKSTRAVSVYSNSSLGLNIIVLCIICLSCSQLVGPGIELDG